MALLAIAGSDNGETATYSLKSSPIGSSHSGLEVLVLALKPKSIELLKWFSFFPCKKSSLNLKIIIRLPYFVS